jgi:hypothetical protein
MKWSSKSLKGFPRSNEVSLFQVDSTVPDNRRFEVALYLYGKRLSVLETASGSRQDANPCILQYLNTVAHEIAKGLFLRARTPVPLFFPTHFELLRTRDMESSP